MKKTPLLLTLGFVLLVAGGITLYQFIANKKDVSVWDLIPRQTVLVYEFDECKECTPNPKKSVVHKILETIFLDFTDSTKRKLEALSTQKKQDVISLHTTSKDDFDIVYYFPETEGGKFGNAINTWKSDPVTHATERILNGSKILEFAFEKKTFSCVQIENIWVGSFTPFLIEDVIRTYVAKDQISFQKEIAGVYALPRINGDPGNFYIHLSSFSSWLKVFFEKAPDIFTAGQASSLDVKEDDLSITLNGYTLTKQNEESLLGYFEKQSPVQFRLKQYISNRTALAINYGISDGLAFYQTLHLSKKGTAQESLSKIVKTDFEKLFSSFGKEMAITAQESRSNSFSEVLLFETSKPDEWLTFFNQLSAASEREDTVFYEEYSTYQIREIEINDLVGKLFSPLASGFSQTYYTSIGNVIIMGERLEDIKLFLNDIDQENVWGKSLPINRFLESTLLESNVSIYVNTPLVWASVSNGLSPRWKRFVSESQSLLNSFSMGAVQFSHLNESFYTNLLWTYSDKVRTEKSQRTKEEKIVASINSPIISGPFVVKSHVNSENEVLIQDSLYNLYHLSADGKILWKTALGEPVVDEIDQIDFFNNGKLQFFFATETKLHVIDRLGNYVSPFPIDIKGKTASAKVVDYDNSKKYRFLVADRSGKLWMYDKEGANLEGWKPRNVENTLFASARHHRIRGKDYVLAIRKDGIAYLMNRRGDLVKGFPASLDARPDGQYFIEIGNSVATTNFVCISKDGFRIKFNLEGKVITRETLLKPSFETQFSLIPDQQAKSYVIKRQDSKKLSLLNEEGVELLSNGYVGFNPVRIKYYDFGAGKIYFAITDLSQDISFIYDGKGNQLNATPINGSAIELGPGDLDSPKTFVVDGTTLTVQ
jgi:hypothetical protein